MTTELAAHDPETCGICIAQRRAGERPQLVISFERPPVESYVRISVEVGAFCCEPALEWRDGDDFDQLAAALRLLARATSTSGNAMERAQQIGAAIAAQWPATVDQSARAYFVEVWPIGGDGFAQVFQPFGVPRNR